MDTKVSLLVKKMGNPKATLKYTLYPEYYVMGDLSERAPQLFIAPDVNRASLYMGKDLVARQTNKQIHEAGFTEPVFRIMTPASKRKIQLIENPLTFKKGITSTPELYDI